MRDDAFVNRIDDLLDDHKELEEVINEARLLLLEKFRKIVNNPPDNIQPNKNPLVLLDECRRSMKPFVEGRMQTDNERKRALFRQVYLWLDDEIILVGLQSQDYIKHLRLAFQNQIGFNFRIVDINDPAEAPLPPRLGQDVYFGIDFKSAYVKHSKKYMKKDKVVGDREPISMVVQAIFVVCHNKGKFYTLHDRSYTGAEDKQSKYALVTDRVSTEDLPLLAGDSRPLGNLCQNTLFRGVQEPDELGLSDAIAKKYTRHPQISGLHNAWGMRQKYVGLYEGENGMVLSFLFAIFVTVDEYNRELTRRGPHLLPVTPRAFSKLRQLHLLNDILNHNSCNDCQFDVDDSLTGCRSRNDPCIIRDVDQHLNAIFLNHFPPFNPAQNHDSNLMRYLLDENGKNIVIVLDVPQYALLPAETVLKIREQLESLIYTFLPFYLSGSTICEHHIEMTPEGYIIILDKRTADGGDISGIALIGYFFALYVGIKMTDLKKWKKNSYPDIRIGLHAANLEISELSGNSFTKCKRHFGSDISKTIYLTDVAQPNQILCSQDFVIQTIVEFEKIRTNDLIQLMEQLNIPPSAIKEICQNEDLTKKLINPQNMFQDFGYFTHDNGVRYRVFNLVAPADQENSDGEISSENLLGNIVPPTALVPIIYRTPTTANDEQNRLVRSLSHADHVMMYGFSNVRVTREIYERYYVKQEDDLTLNPKSFKIIFYSPDQEINDNQQYDIALRDWIKGFLCANWIVKHLRRGKTKCEIVINSTRYGFNVFKIMYKADLPQEQDASLTQTHRDYIRFTLPMPGKAFHLSPVFIINRGDPLYHNFLEISEKYVEKGIKETSDERSITRYVPNDKGKELIEELFNINTKEQDDNKYNRHDKRCNELLEEHKVNGVFDYQQFLNAYFNKQ